MHTYRTSLPARPRARRSMLLGLALTAAVFGLGACQMGTNAVPTLPSLALPTFPPDDMASGTSACIDVPTMAIIDQLRATGADVPAVIAANKDVLVAGLERLESSDATTTAWRDAMVAAVKSGDAADIALQVSRLKSGQVTITPC
jgi:hypothetical protein